MISQDEAVAKEVASKNEAASDRLRERVESLLADVEETVRKSADRLQQEESLSALRKKERELTAFINAARDRLIEERERRESEAKPGRFHTLNYGHNADRCVVEFNFGEAFNSQG